MPNTITQIGNSVPTNSRLDLDELERRDRKQERINSPVSFADFLPRPDMDKAQAMIALIQSKGSLNGDITNEKIKNLLIDLGKKNNLDGFADLLKTVIESGYKEIFLDEEVIHFIPQAITTLTNGEGRSTEEITKGVNLIGLSGKAEINFEKSINNYSFIEGTIKNSLGKVPIACANAVTDILNSDLEKSIIQPESLLKLVPAVANRFLHGKFYKEEVNACIDLLEKAFELYLQPDQEDEVKLIDSALEKLPEPNLREGEKNLLESAQRLNKTYNFAKKIIGDKSKQFPISEKLNDLSTKLKIMAIKLSLLGDQMNGEDTLKLDGIRLLEKEKNTEGLNKDEVKNESIKLFEAAITLIDEMIKNNYKVEKVCSLIGGLKTLDLDLSSDMAEKIFNIIKYGLENDIDVNKSSVEVITCYMSTKSQAQEAAMKLVHEVHGPKYKNKFDFKPKAIEFMEGHIGRKIVLTKEEPVSSIPEIVLPKPDNKPSNVSLQSKPQKTIPKSELELALEEVNKNNFSIIRALFQNPNYVKTLNSNSQSRALINEFIMNSHVEKAIDLIKLCLENGVRYETSSLPITTQTTIVNGHHEEQNEIIKIKTAELLMEALKNDLDIPDQIITTTVVHLLNPQKTINLYIAQAKLIKFLIEKEKLNIHSEKMLRFLYTTLARLGTYKGHGEEHFSLYDLSCKASYGVELAELIIGKDIPLYKKGLIAMKENQVPFHLRMDYFIKDVTHIARKSYALHRYLIAPVEKKKILYKEFKESGILKENDLTLNLEERNLGNEAQKLLMNCLELISKAIKKYELSERTINLVIDQIGANRIHFTEGIVKSAEKVIKKFVEHETLKKEFNIENINHYLISLINSRKDYALKSALIIAEFLKRNSIFLPLDTMNGIYTGTSSLTDPKINIQEKREELKDEFNKRKSKIKPIS